MKIIKKNPFRVSFLTAAVACCIILSIVFSYISYSGNKAIEEKYNKDKVEMCLEELEVQLQLMKDVALQIVSDYEFWPSYFAQDLTKEWSMLGQFKSYAYYTMLSDECFLDYGGDLFYTSHGYRSTLDVFLRNNITSEEEKQYFLDELTKQREGLTGICGEPKMISTSESIYVLIPFRIDEEIVDNNAILGFKVKKEVLEKRFQIASGEISGGLSLYENEEALYSNQKQSALEQQKDVVTAVSQNGRYTIYYSPGKEFSLQTGLLFLHLALILVDVILILVVVSIFAEKTYKPIRFLAESYRSEVPMEKINQENALDELKMILDRMMQCNKESSIYIKESQKIFREQVLKMILEGSALGELQYYLEKAQIDLPGPLYCVISISFEKEEGVTNAFLNELQEELERIPDINEKERIYVTVNEERKLLNAICSIPSEEERDEFLETICDVAESFGYKPVIGIGNTYPEIRQLFASWMESMDATQFKKAEDETEENGGFIYQAEDVRRIMSALESGIVEISVKRLEEFVEKLKAKPLSMLMMQYILSDFLSEIRKLCEKYHLEISKQSVSLLLSIKNVQDFEVASKNVIYEFHESYGSLRNQAKDIEAKKICAYIDEHFMEYDLSGEGVASHFHVSTDVVRQAVMLHTGKLYRDYVIYLRIEYAKVLLSKEDIPVAELCRKVGYGNVSYFIKLFREFTGVTPAKYRKNIGGK